MKQTLCLKQTEVDLPNHQICQNYMNLRALVNFVYIMNHIDKQVIFTIPLSRVPIMAHYKELTFVRKILMGEVFRWAKLLVGRNFRRAKLFVRQNFCQFSKKSSLSPTNFLPIRYLLYKKVIL